jgi:23S rRNA (cytidine1920-2'-O)/16S rRNA (cytidine1409-2'-O)-methyltransferase
MLLVERQLAASRSHAQALIAAGRVFAAAPGGGEGLVKKASQAIAPETELRVAASPTEEFVSRGGLKLAGALERAALSLNGARVLDIGLSTGGFAECCLRRGAAFVLGVDVGHGQLHPSLRSNPRLRSLEGINARELPRSLIAGACPTGSGEAPFDLVVIDVSFISLTLVLAPAIQYLKNSGIVLALVKPQFEVGRQGLGKGGIVKDPAEREKAKRKILECARALGLEAEDYFESSIQGTDGNREFFILARKP